MKMRTNWLLSLLLIITSPVAVLAQQVEVQGPQQGVWDADTVLVTGNVKVVESLEVQPGTTVLFNGFYHLEVGSGAVLSAQGAAGDSVVFTVADTLGFHTVDSPKGGWNGLQVKGGRLELDYCVFEYGKAALLEDQEGGAMRIDGGEVSIAHSSLRNNYSRDRGGAIHAQDANFQMIASQVNDNRVFSDSGAYAMYGGGASFLRCNVFMEDMEFLRNYAPSCIGGALSLDSCQVDLHGALFADNIGLNGGGMYIMRNNFTNSTLYNLAFIHNFSRHFAGGIAFADSSPTVYNLLVTDNCSEGVNCNGVFFYQDCRPQMTNCIIYQNYPWIEDIHSDSAQMWLWTFEGYAPEFRNCLIDGGRKKITGADYIQVFEDILDTDPLFVDAPHRDFHLSEHSPCRDAGYAYVPYDLLVGHDLDGLPRVKQQRIDIGPYEYSGTSVDETTFADGALRLVGNPLGQDSRLVVELAAPETLGVRLFSVDGRLMAEQAPQPFGAGRVELPVGDLVGTLPPGMYLFEVQGGNHHRILKAVK